MCLYQSVLKGSWELVAILPALQKRGEGPCLRSDGKLLVELGFSVAECVWRPLEHPTCVVPFRVPHCCGSGWPNSKLPAVFRTFHTHQSCGNSVVNPHHPDSRMINSWPILFHSRTSLLPLQLQRWKFRLLTVKLLYCPPPIVDILVYLLSSHI